MLKRRLLIRSTVVLLAIGGAIGLQKFCHSKTDGFALYKISSTLTYHPEWDSSSNLPVDQVHSFLEKPYYYLGKGAQCYVFLSEDGQQVLKFFRLYHLRPPFWLMHLPIPKSLESYRQKKVTQKNEELNKDFISYALAFKHLKNETGLIYTHLNKTSHLHKTITLYDKIKVKHSVDADSMEFLIQKRAESFYPFLETLIENKEEDAIKEILSSLVSLLITRSEKGLFDKDPDINTNFGICEKKPIQIDVGRFRPDLSRKAPAIYKEDIIRITDSLCQWLEQKDPNLASYLKMQIQTQCGPI